MTTLLSATATSATIARIAELNRFIDATQRHADGLKAIGLWRAADTAQDRADRYRAEVTATEARLNALVTR